MFPVPEWCGTSRYKYNMRYNSGTGNMLVDVTKAFLRQLTAPVTVFLPWFVYVGRIYNCNRGDCGWGREGVPVEQCLYFMKAPHPNPMYCTGESFDTIAPMPAEPGPRGRDAGRILHLSMTTHLFGEIRDVAVRSRNAHLVLVHEYN